MIGDGGFVFALEKRGYVEAGPWTPEAVIENPEVCYLVIYDYFYLIFEEFLCIFYVMPSFN